MTLAEHLLKQVDYNLWANRSMTDALVVQDFTEHPVYKVFCHVLGAEATWASRCLGIEPAHATWPQVLPEALHTVALENYQSLSGIVMDNAADLMRVIAYKNSDGVAFETPIADIFQHMLLHGQYHRGQVNAQLRAGGLKPVRVDFIIYLREGYKTLPALLA